MTVGHVESDLIGKRASWEDFKAQVAAAEEVVRRLAQGMREV